MASVLSTTLTLFLMLEDFDPIDGLPEFAHKLGKTLHESRDLIDPKREIRISFYKGADLWAHCPEQILHNKEVWPRKNSSKRKPIEAISFAWARTMRVAVHRASLPLSDATIINRLHTHGYPTTIRVEIPLKDPDRPPPKPKTAWDHILG
jgi:hypothetical protein